MRKEPKPVTEEDVKNLRKEWTDSEDIDNLYKKWVADDYNEGETYTTWEGSSNNGGLFTHISVIMFIISFLLIFKPNGTLLFGVTLLVATVTSMIGTIQRNGGR